MLHLAGRRYWYAVRLKHNGRRSGRTYATPVVARAVPGGFAIPLAYGRDVDWHRNLTAAGRGVLAVHGTRYTITKPHTVPAAEVTGTLTPHWRRMLRGIDEYVVVSAEPLNPAKSGECA
jgi:deazaflavin-dependent oxidoreductase (nitroreductase family)